MKKLDCLIQSFANIKGLILVAPLAFLHPGCVIAVSRDVVLSLVATLLRSASGLPEYKT